MLLALLGQALTHAFAASAAIQSHEHEHKHELLHWLDREHHHHTDGSYHFDDSTESAKHILLDHCGNMQMLTLSVLPGLPHPENSGLLSLDSSFIALLSPDGLYRPPRTHS